MRIAVFAWCLLALILPMQAETPREFAHRFYRNVVRWEIQGVPDAGERRRISPYFSAEILRLYAVATRQREDFTRRFPFDPKHPEKALKPPWSKEGDPFSDCYEGITTFAIGRPTRAGSRIAVPVHLEYIPGERSAWTDTLILDRAAGAWVIADIRFSKGGSLVGGLRKGIAEHEQESRANSQ